MLLVCDLTLNCKLYPTSLLCVTLPKTRRNLVKLLKYMCKTLYNICIAMPPDLQHLEEHESGRHTKPGGAGQAGGVGLPGQ